MGVSLSKGGNVSLSKEAPGLQTVRVGLGWDARATDGQAFDLDASAFILNGEKVRSDADFIFYNNKNGASGAVVHQGDNTTGEGEGDDEVVTVRQVHFRQRAIELDTGETILVEDLLDVEPLARDPRRRRPSSARRRNSLT